jgi:hypothetical protein
MLACGSEIEGAMSRDKRTKTVDLTHNWRLFELSPDGRTIRIAYDHGPGYRAPSIRAEVQETADEVTLRLVQEVVAPRQPDGSRRLITTTGSVVDCAAVSLEQPLGSRRLYAYTVDRLGRDARRRSARRAETPLGMRCRSTPRKSVTFRAFTGP